MSRHRASANPTDVPDLLTGPIPINAEVRANQLETRLANLRQDLATWQDLETRWGHINYLIEAINQTNWLVGSDEIIPEGLW